MATLLGVGDNADMSNTKRRWLDQYVGPAAYVAGGDPFLPEEAKMGVIYAMNGLVLTNGVICYIGAYRPLLNTIQWFVPNINVEVAVGVDLSGFGALIEVIGR